MNLLEYEKVKNMDYLQYCEYLQNKYGKSEYSYKDDKSIRDGLFRHHLKENIKANLSNKKVMMESKSEYQDGENIVYCDYLEHLLLHIMIGEQTDSRLALGLGGAINFIIPDLINYFNTGIKLYNDSYYDNLDKELFNTLVDRCNDTKNKTKISLEHNDIIEKQMEGYLDTEGKALIILGTGLGKTTTALQYLWSHSCRALVIGPNNLIKTGWEEYTDWVDTTTYQSFAKQYTDYDYSKYGLVILDEAHHAGYDEENDTGAKVWTKGIKYIMKNGVKVLGLTATPERSSSLLNILNN